MRKMNVGKSLWMQVLVRTDAVVHIQPYGLRPEDALHRMTTVQDKTRTRLMQPDFRLSWLHNPGLEGAVELPVERDRARFHSRWTDNLAGREQRRTDGPQQQQMTLSSVDGKQTSWHGRVRLGRCIAELHHPADLPLLLLHEVAVPQERVGHWPSVSGYRQKYQKVLMASLRSS